MLANLDYFPNTYLDLLKNIILEDDSYSFVSVSCIDDNWCNVSIQCTDYSSLVLLGMKMGLSHYNTMIKNDFLPKITKSVSKIVNKPISHSDN